MKNIAFFGGGNIAQSIIKGLINSGYCTKNIFFVDRNSNNQKALKKLGIKKLSGAKHKIDIYILAVKPKDATAAFQTILKKDTKPKIVSLVAGLKTKRYKSFGKNIEIMRAMPNTSSKYGLGITAIYNSSFKQRDLSRVIKLFEKIGIIITVKKENKLDAFTGMIGSGPAYFFYLLKSYEKKLLELCNGNKKKVNEIIVNLIKGVGASVENDKDLDKLISAVASKRGTTEAGLKSFKENKLNKVFEKGLKAAIKRSGEISNEY
tara:strand:- start:2209 stop:2997 length:789 start_codon:yes stop_codon:yes gene_type:complete